MIRAWNPSQFQLQKKPEFRFSIFPHQKKKKKIETNITNKQSKIIVKDEFFSKNKKLGIELLT